MMAAKTIVIVGNVLLLLAWPIGYLLGTIASRSSDAAGRGYAVLTVWALTLFATYLIVAVVFLITGFKYWSQMGFWLKVFVCSPAWVTGVAILVGIIVGVGIAMDLW
jgi:hypothetical protein